MRGHLQRVALQGVKETELFLQLKPYEMEREIEFNTSPARGLGCYIILIYEVISAESMTLFHGHRLACSSL